MASSQVFSSTARSHGRPFSWRRVGLYAGSLTVGLLLSWEARGAFDQGSSVAFLLEAGLLVVSISLVSWVIIRLAERKVEELERRSRDSERLLEAYGRISNSLDPARATQVIVNDLVTLLGALNAVLWGLNEESGNLEALAASRELTPIADRVIEYPRGMGAVGLAVSERRPVTTPDILADFRIILNPESREWIERLPARAVLALPLIADGEVIGALSVADERGRQFDVRDIRLAELFAGRAALALRNAQLYSDSQRRVAHTETLLAVSRSVGSTLDLTETMRLVSRDLARALGADTVGAYVPDGGGGTLRPLAGYHVPGGLRETFGLVPLPLRGHPFLEDGWVEQGVAFSADIAVDPRVDRAIVDRLPNASVLFVPLVYQGELVGGLFAAWWKTHNALALEELRLAQGIGQQAALSVAHARRYAESERRRRAAERLAEVGRLVSQSLDPMVVLQRIAESLQSLLGTAISRVYRLDQDSGRMVAEVSCGPYWPDSIKPRVTRVGMDAVGLAVETAAAVVTLDVLSDARIRLAPEVREAGKNSGHRAALAVPLLVKDRVIGGLVVVDRTGRHFGSEEIALAEAFASQAAVAFENAQLHAEAGRRRSIAEKLAAIGHLVSESLEPHIVADRIVESPRSLLGAPVALLFRHEPETGDFVTVASVGDLGPAIVPGAVFPEGTGPCGVAVREGRPVTTDDILADPRIRLTPPMRSLIEGIPFRAVVCVPLFVQGRIVGTLMIADRAGRVFSAEDVDIVSTFAGAAASALERARLFTDLQRTLGVLTGLSHRLMTVQEEERRHLARELHDDIGQLLAGLKLSVQVASRRCSDELREPLGHIQELAAELIGRVREMAVGLRPPMLDDLGLVPALISHFERFTRQTNVDVKLSHADLERRLPPAVEVVAFRIIQEALNNVARHACSLEATVRLSADEHVVRGSVEDHGVGFHAEEVAGRASNGLTGMRERAELVGGGITVESIPGLGTHVKFELPLGGQRESVPWSS